MTKNKLFFILLMYVFFGEKLNAQKIEAIEINIEPNTHARRQPRKGFKTYKLRYLRNQKNELEVNSVEVFFTNSQSKKKKKLKSTIKVNARDLSVLETWLRNDKNKFSLKELGVSLKEFSNQPEIRKYKRKLPIDSIREIEVDTFNLCNKHQLVTGWIIGHDEFDITIFTKRDTINFFKYEYPLDIYRNTLDIKGYLTLQSFLFIPDGLEVNHIFSKKELKRVLNYYYKMIECEGYYYKEFISQNPQRKEIENEMMIDWDFKAYLEKRKKK